MTGFSTCALLFCFVVDLQQGMLHALDSCEPEGSIQLAVNDTQEYIDSKNQTYHLLQVCLFGHWSYVCNNSFGHGPTAFDRNIALFQLGCVSGGTQGFPNTNSMIPAYLTNIACLGVERRLVDCRRAALSNITSCDKVGAYCTESGDDLMCQNGDIQIKSGTIGIVEICDRGAFWRRLCPNEYFWGPPQAAVACRQLHPGKTVIGARATIVTYALRPNFLYHIQCTGDESRLTDCTIRYSINRNLCDGNEVAGVECDIENVPSPPHQVSSSSAMILMSTTTMTYTPVCSTESIPRSLGASSTPLSCSHTSLVSSSPLPWVGGVIIGAVLSTAILLTVLVAVCLLRRRKEKRTHAQLKMSTNELFDSSVKNSSLVNGTIKNPPPVQQPVPIQMNAGAYNRHHMQAQIRPQPYEEVGLNEQELEYSYAAHGVDTNIYDSVLQQEDGYCDNSNQVVVVDNNVLYSKHAENEDTGQYSSLKQK